MNKCGHSLGLSRPVKTLDSSSPYYTSIPRQAFGRNRRPTELGHRGGVASLEQQPFLPCHPSAPKTQWVMVAALWYRPSDWLEPMRLLRGRFKGKGAVARKSPFPVATLKRPHPPGVRAQSMYASLPASGGVQRSFGLRLLQQR
jgi:hypothetical protein